MRTVRIVTEPSVEPVTADEALASSGAEDTTTNRALLEALIAASRQAVEAYLGRALITQQRELVLDRLPGNGWLGLEALSRTPAPPGSWVELPGGALQAVDSVKLYDDTDAATVVDNAVYHVDTAHEPGRLQLRSGQTWPTLANPAPTGAARVTYTCGYGDAAASVPRLIRQAILAEVASRYNHPDPSVQSETVGNASVVYAQASAGAVRAPTLDPLVRVMLDPHRIIPGLT